ncbi:MAG: dodecin family protein [Limnochordia bacterium]|nr:dodecin family protein [Bacillota bacterium]HOB07875.1 dodecin family protein [Limnochordia bacterium]NLH31168.1 dodecin domain-containing protein [Bacillota bacterium]HPT93216.1 dodecin family protein [Limnochordia bacterium]HPZ29972.1 dodecin family protein [Limnochordia bacterium]
MAVIKVIELVGQSKKGWDAAVKSAVAEAAKTIRHISGVEVLNWTGNVVDGEVVEYKVNVKIAFRVEPEDE